MSDQAQFGIIGLAVMGQNLALNVEDHGYSVAMWNLETEVTERFVASEPRRRFTGVKTLAELVAKLERPRRILMMIKAGDPVDQVLTELRPRLDRGDIVIDGGNSCFQDTRRRERLCAAEGLHFVGMGVSGGEDGARHGPSLMPGGSEESYAALRPVLEAIAAKTESGPCTTWVGPDGAGHYVKMVHNGIEYADMQLIAEVYELLRRVARLDAAALSEVFTRWNHGPLESFLVEITATIFRVKDPQTGVPLIDLVLDQAGQKGTGKWTVQVALDLGVPVPSIAAALDARLLSAQKAERVRASGLLSGPDPGEATHDPAHLVDVAHDALLAAKICAYAQGMSLIRAGSLAYGWEVKLEEMARIWKGGCIIRARLLDSIMRAFHDAPDLDSLLLDPALGGDVERHQQALRHVVSVAARAGLAVPALAASLGYYDACRTAELPQNLTQAQRDAFGAHTYQRKDHPERGFIHTDWLGERKAGA